MWIACGDWGEGCGWRREKGSNPCEAGWVHYYIMRLYWVFCLFHCLSLFFSMPGSPPERLECGFAADLFSKCWFSPNFEFCSRPSQSSASEKGASPHRMEKSSGEIDTLRLHIKTVKYTSNLSNIHFTCVILLVTSYGYNFVYIFWVRFSDTGVP